MKMIIDVRMRLRYFIIVFEPVGDNISSIKETQRERKKRRKTERRT